MKFGMRKPNIKKSIKARTTGKINRKIKKSINPLYGKKGIGMVRNPKKSLYDKVYKKTSFSFFSLFKFNKSDTKFRSTTIDLDKNDPYDGYPDDLRKSCEYDDKYQYIWDNASKYIEKINYFYSKYTNYNKEEDFNNLLIYCNKHIELLPKLEEAKNEDYKINGTIYSSKYCIAYHKLAMAYEKKGCYSDAISICNEAISKGYSDGTKGDFEARIKKLKNKLKEN